MASSVTIQDLMNGVRRALAAVVPVAESIGVPWREPDAYDAWDEVADGIFNGFVKASLEDSVNASRCLPINRYGFHIDDYSPFSFIAVLTGRGPMPFISFETADQPFDTCLAGCLDSDRRVVSVLRLPFQECRFALLARYPDQPDEVIEVLQFT